MERKPTNPKDAVGSRKAPISTVPIQVVTETGLAMLEGCKYGRHNYRADGVRASVYVDAVWRHLFQQWWDQGEDIDPDSGLNHVTKAIASLMVIRDSMLQGNFVDDRPPKAKTKMRDFNKRAEEVLDKIEPREPWTELRVQKGRMDEDNNNATACGPPGERWASHGETA